MLSIATCLLVLSGALVVQSKPPQGHSNGHNNVQTVANNNHGGNVWNGNGGNNGNNGGSCEWKQNDWNKFNEQDILNKIKAYLDSTLSKKCPFGKVTQAPPPTTAKTSPSTTAKTTPPTTAKTTPSTAAPTQAPSSTQTPSTAAPPTAAPSTTTESTTTPSTTEAPTTTPSTTEAPTTSPQNFTLPPICTVDSPDFPACLGPPGTDSFSPPPLFRRRK